MDVTKIKLSTEFRVTPQPVTVISCRCAGDKSQTILQRLTLTRQNLHTNIEQMTEEMQSLALNRNQRGARITQETV